MIDTMITKNDFSVLKKLLGWGIAMSYVYKGVRYEGMECVPNARTICYRTGARIKKTVVTGKHHDGLEVSLEFTQFRDFPVCEWKASFQNFSKDKSGVISDIKIFDSVINCKNPVAVTGNGECFSADGLSETKSSLTEKITLTPRDGLSSSFASPYMRLLTDEGGLNLAIGWAGMWEATLEPVSDGVRYTVGQKRCNMRLEPGENIQTPRLTALAFEGEELRGINIWRKWYFKHILPKEVSSPKLVLHTWMLDGKEEFIGTNEANQITAINSYINKGMKPDIWWIDAGWYACPDGHWGTNVGTWRHDRMRFPDGLRPIAKKCKKEGIRLLVWFEPERVMKGSFIYNEHPEFLLSCPDNNGTYAFNFSDKNAVEWIGSYIGDYLKENRITIYRQDMNFPILPYWQTAETADRIGVVENHYISGLMAFWDILRKKNPGLIIDNCSSGGRRNDLETMRRSVPLHYTDYGYGEHPVKQAQHNYMHSWMPYFRAHAMSWDNDNGTYLPVSSKPVDSFAYHCAMAPAMTSMVEYYDSEETFERLCKLTPIWRRAAEYMLSGDFYPLTECRKSCEDYYAVQFDKGSNEGYFQVIRNTNAKSDSFTVFPQLDFSCDYHLVNKETGKELTVSGSLLKNGFTVRIPKRSGVIWFYENNDNRILPGVFDKDK